MPEEKENERATNTQVTDSITQTNQFVEGNDEAVRRAMTYQVMSHAIGIAMQNVVAQQQNQHVIVNSLTAAAAKAIMEDGDGASERVNNLLKLIETVQKNGLESASQLEKLGSVQSEIAGMTGNAGKPEEPQDAGKKSGK